MVCDNLIVTLISENRDAFKKLVRFLFVLTVNFVAKVKNSIWIPINPAQCLSLHGLRKTDQKGLILSPTLFNFNGSQFFILLRMVERRVHFLGWTGIFGCCINVLKMEIDLAKQ